jgi:hypothetical protein
MCGAPRSHCDYCGGESVYGGDCGFYCVSEGSAMGEFALLLWYDLFWEVLFSYLNFQFQLVHFMYILFHLLSVVNRGFYTTIKMRKGGGTAAGLRCLAARSRGCDKV